jgi:SnoaL-like domain
MDLTAFYARYLATCNAHDLAGLDAFVAEDVVVNGEPVGLDAYFAGLRAVIEAFPDYRSTESAPSSADTPTPLTPWFPGPPLRSGSAVPCRPRRVALRGIRAGPAGCGVPAVRRAGRAACRPCGVQIPAGERGAVASISWRVIHTVR